MFLLSLSSLFEMSRKLSSDKPIREVISKEVAAKPSTSAVESQRSSVQPKEVNTGKNVDSFVKPRSVAIAEEEEEVEENEEENNDENDDEEEEYGVNSEEDDLSLRTPRSPRSKTFSVLAEQTAIHQILKQWDKEKAPKLTSLSTNNIREFVKAYDEYKEENAGQKSMADCIVKELHRKIRYKLEEEYWDTDFLKLEDNVVRAVLLGNQRQVRHTAKDVLDAMSSVKMVCKGRWVKRYDVEEYLSAIDEVTEKYESIQLKPVLWIEQVLKNLSNNLGFKETISIEVRQKGITDSVRQVKHLLLRHAEDLESKFIQPSFTRTDGDSAKSVPKKAAATAAIDPVNNKTTATPSVPVAEIPISEVPFRTPHRPQNYSCWNCGGSHKLGDCTVALNQSVIAANKAAFESKKKEKKLWVDTSKKASVSAVKSIENSGTELSSKEVFSNNSTHIRVKLEGDFQNDIVAHIDTGANVSVISNKLANQLIASQRCAEKVVNLEVNTFLRDVKTRVTSQLLGLKVQAKTMSGPVSFVINPFVAEIIDDIIIDRDTALGVGLIDLRVPYSEVVISPHECESCGAAIQLITNETLEDDSFPTTAESSNAKDFVIGPAVDEKFIEVLNSRKEAFMPHFSESLDLPAFKIELIPDISLPRKGPRRMSPSDNAKTEGHVQELLELGVIRASSSPVSSPTVLVKYEDGSTRLCIDYREINDATKGLQYPTRNLKEVVDRVAGRKILGKMDLYKGYHQIPMDSESIYLTAFATSTGLYEFTRLPFGLKNAPAAFQQRMDHIFADLLFKICEIYLDDIIIFGNSPEEFTTNCMAILDRLIQFKLTAKISKCAFGFFELPFLGFLVSANGYRMSPDRVQAILSMHRPANRKEMRSYLGLINYFSSFIPNMAEMCRPLYAMITSTAFHWSEIEIAAFDQLKQVLADVPTLEFINYDKDIVLRTDASDRAVGGVLFQEYENKIHIIQYVSRSFSGAELNWSTIEKEAFALYHCILKLAHYLSGHQFILQTDHRNLVYLHKAEVPKLVRWRLRLQEFTFVVQHIPGRTNIVADSLSRFCRQCVAVVGALRRIFNADIIEKFHNSSFGHRGVTVTINALKDNGFEWPRMQLDVADFLRRCPTCQKNKAASAVSVGPNRTITVYEPFQRLAMDFVGPLPIDARGNMFILVVVDCFSRWVELFALPEAKAELVAECLLNIFSTFGLPEEILSDNGPQFISTVLQQLMSALDVDQIYSTPHHHQGNGQVERFNYEVMRHLRNIVFQRELYNDWSRFLPHVKHLLNGAVSSATGLSPMAMLFGTALPLYRGLKSRRYPNAFDVERDEWFAQRLEAIELRLQEGREQQAELEGKVLDNQPTVVDQFHVDEWVWLSYPERPPSKLHPRRSGPYKIISKKNRTYEVQNILTNKVLKVDIERLSRVTLDDTSIENIKNLLSRDLQEYIVESVLEHRNNNGKHQFLIKWLNYPEEQNTWEPYENLRDNIFVKEFIRANRLKIKYHG